MKDLFSVGGGFSSLDGGGTGTKAAIGCYSPKQNRKEQMIRCHGQKHRKSTSSAVRAFSASFTAIFMESQAHLAWPRVHPSCSPLRRGAYTVGQNSDFNARDVGVSAADVGTVRRNGSRRLRSGGRVGALGDVERRRVVLSSRLRTRFRWPSESDSRPLVLSHLPLIF